MFGEIAPKAGGGAKPLVENSNTGSALSWASGVNSIISGPSALSFGHSTVVIGAKAVAQNASTVVLGANAIGNTSAVSVGATANAGNSCIAIGSTAGGGTSNYSVAVGTNAGTSNVNGSVSIGMYANCTAGAGIAIGGPSSGGSSAAPISTGNFAIAIGGGTGSVHATTAAGGIAIGGSENVSVTVGQTGVVIGYNGQASQQGAVGFGPWVGTDFQGEIGFCTGRWTSNGDFKIFMVPLRQQTTDATPLEFTTGKGDQGAVATSPIVLTNNSTYIFDVDIVARKSTTGTDYSAWNLKFCINREANAASTALVGTVTKTLIGQTSGASTWDVSATADTTNGRPNISVTGQASTTIRWVGNVRGTKVQG